MTYTKFAIGDVHGCYDQLLELVGKCRDYANQTRTLPHLIFIGDYVDRGPKSYEVVKYLKGLHDFGSCEKVRITCLAGNHDYDFSVLVLTLGEAWKKFSVGVDSQTLRSYIEHEDEIKEHAQWLGRLPFSYEDKFRFYCHAGIRPGVPLDKQDPDDLVWIRGEFLNSSLVHPKLIVHGHTAQKGVPEVLENRVNCDTGCVFGYRLTAAVFSDEQVEPITFLSVEGKLRRLLSEYTE